MKTVFSEDHRLHFPQAELYNGEFVTPFERPSRVEYVLRRLKERGLSEIVAPDPVDMAPLGRVHDAGYLDFLATGWDEWVASGAKGEMIATGLPLRRLQQDRIPRHIDGKLGYYTMATETAITSGTWAAARASAPSRNRRSGSSPAANGRPSRSADRRGTMQASTSMAATASSTTPRWRLRCSWTRSPARRAPGSGFPPWQRDAGYLLRAG